MKITVKITKDVLKRSMMCGVANQYKGDSCGVAVAVRDIFPCAHIGISLIYPFTSGGRGDERYIIHLPVVAVDFIKSFDSLGDTPEERLNLPEFSFEIEVPHSVIEKIGIGEAYRVLSESKTLELVHP